MFHAVYTRGGGFGDGFGVGDKKSECFSSYDLSHHELM